MDPQQPPEPPGQPPSPPPLDQQQWEQRRRELDGYDLPTRRSAKTVLTVVLLVLGLILAFAIILIGECMANTHF